MAKPMLVTLPLVLLLLDYWPLGRLTKRDRRSRGQRPPVAVLRRLLLEKLPLLALAAVFCGVDRLGTGARPWKPHEQYSLSWRIGNALIAYVGYLGQFFYPAGLAVLYPRPGPICRCGKVLGASLILAGITAAALLRRRRRPYLLVGWLWYLVMLLPVIGLVQFGVQAVADRFMYLPQIGLGIALAWWAADLCGAAAGCRGDVADCAAPSAGVACLHSAAGRAARLPLGAGGADGMRLASDDVLAGQRNPLDPHAGLHFAQSSWPIITLRIALSDWGLDDDAMVQFLEVRKLEPRYIVGLAHPHAPLTALERYQRAATHYRRAVDRNAADAEARRRLAWLLATCPEASLRNGAEAVELARQADRLSGGRRPDVLDALAAAYAEAGQFPEALATARRALELATQQDKKTLADALRNRIALYEAQRAFHQQ